MTSSVRPLDTSDVEECTQLYINVFNNEPWNDGWEEDDAKERLLDIFNHPKFMGMGIHDEENLVGFLIGHTEKWLSAEHYYLSEMCVDTKEQNKGIGSELISELEEKCGNLGVNRIYLLTARDGQAEYFYKKNNFYVSPKMIMMAKKLEG